MSVKLKWVLKPRMMTAMYPLLQQGFQVTATVGCDIRSLLCDQFGMMPDYLSDRINTIFLNGKPVDDVASAVVNDGATLALSAAMPGLVGATFRKAGCLAAFRGSITYRKGDDDAATCHEGAITLKLFNLLVAEMGPLFLKHGIWINGAELKDFLSTRQSSIETMIESVEKDGHAVDLKTLTEPEWLSVETRVLLQATGGA